MNDDLCELIDMLDELNPAPGVIGVYWNSADKCWRIQLDSEDFLREFDLYDENREPGDIYPYELVVTHGTVEVFCIVRRLPK